MGAPTDTNSLERSDAIAAWQQVDYTPLVSGDSRDLLEALKNASIHLLSQAPERVPLSLALGTAQDDRYRPFVRAFAGFMQLMAAPPPHLRRYVAQAVRLAVLTMAAVEDPEDRAEAYAELSQHRYIADWLAEDARLSA